MKNNSKKRTPKGKVYLSGKVTGDPMYKKKFTEAVLHLMDLGFDRIEIVNPVEHCDDAWGWLRCMMRCVRLEVGCEIVAMLPDWRESRGARIEHRIARMLRKWVIYIK